MVVEIRKRVVWVMVANYEVRFVARQNFRRSNASAWVNGLNAGTKNLQDGKAQGRRMLRCGAVQCGAGDGICIVVTSAGVNGRWKGTRSVHWNRVLCVTIGCSWLPLPYCAPACTCTQTCTCTCRLRRRSRVQSRNPTSGLAFPPAPALTSQSCWTRRRLRTVLCRTHGIHVRVDCADWAD